MKLMSDKELTEVAPQANGMFFDHNGVEIPMDEWSELFQDTEYRTVRRTTFTTGTGVAVTVSTVWVGIGLSSESFFSKLRGVQYNPYIFETASWSDDQPIEVEARYATAEAAARGHLMTMAEFSGPHNVSCDIRADWLEWGETE